MPRTCCATYAALPTSVWISTYAVTAIVVPSLEPTRGHFRAARHGSGDRGAGPWSESGRGPGRGREASARIARQVRDALAALLDQKTPFGRLALTQVVLTAGDALLTVSLAGSIFFKVSTGEARSNVILYLLL